MKSTQIERIKIGKLLSHKKKRFGPKKYSSPVSCNFFLVIITLRFEKLYLKRVVLQITENFCFP